jgi:hypothetical protein
MPDTPRPRMSISRRAYTSAYTPDHDTSHPSLGIARSVQLSGGYLRPGTGPNPYPHPQTARYYRTAAEIVTVFEHVVLVADVNHLHQIHSLTTLDTLKHDKRIGASHDFGDEIGLDLTPTSAHDLLTLAAAIYRCYAHLAHYMLR